MGTEQSSPANGPSKEEQEVISSMQVIGERGRSIEQKKRNTKISNESLEDTTFIEVDQFGESMTDTESESEYSSSDEIEIEDSGEDADRALVLEDARKLKKLAMVFLHPEVNVSSTSPTAFGRNYFSRPSAIEQEGINDAEERAQILADAAAFKKLAIDYAHPEVNVSSTSPTAFGRNYFSRPSAIEQEGINDAEDRAQILADAAELKKLAIDYAHPEANVSSIAPSTFGRNYFSRPSAIEQEGINDAEERAQILADAAAFKKLAIDYAHPEANVSSTSPTAFGRNYFSRPSAIEQEGINDAEERAQILADAAAFKNIAIDYSHPENVVSTSDGASFGRNYFNMLSMRNPLPLSNVIPSSQEGNTLRTKKVDKQQVAMSKLNSSKDSIHKKLSEIDTCNVKRSPSSVILFGLGDDDGSAY